MKENGKNRWYLNEEKILSVAKIFKGIISLTAEISTAIAVIIGYRTLSEDIVSRNSSYMPLLKAEQEVEDERITLSWNTKGETSSDPVLPELSFSLYNIGNGVANNVEIEFDQEILREWIEQLKNMGADGEYGKLIDEENLCIHISWIMNDPDDSKIVNIPSVYLECLREIYRWQEIRNYEQIDLPGINFRITYEDIQGEPVIYKYVCDDIIIEEKPVYYTDTKGNKSRQLSFTIGTGERIK